MKSLASLVAFSVAVAGPAVAAPLTNGSFEHPAGVAAASLQAGSTFLPGWTVVDSVPGGDADVQYTGNAAYGGVGVIASDGQYLLDLTGSVGRGKGVASDPIDVVAGTTYRVGFDVGAFFIARYGSYGDSTVDLLVNDVLAGSFTNIMDLTAPGSDWLRFTYDFKATGPTVKLTFLSSTSLSSSNLGVGLDNVTLSAVQGSGAASGGVPEPASWALMIGGFCGVGAAARARRRIAAV